MLRAFANLGDLGKDSRVMRGSIRSLSFESFLRKFHGGVGHMKKIRTSL
jgi:hypothetical protein